ncbi:Pop7p [Sugiyamaella lignohabitans]|uniref:Pop7p n=1 Tax=Sugiyamaella lignohabitans TaxID=796027 RepID=A0A167EGC2_9ASCO|nr:Pop7p [Sugiyamaella lignohabitans]ANB14048.1 Pop7p [Sugiyamaella lignohabitans]
MVYSPSWPSESESEISVTNNSTKSKIQIADSKEVMSVFSNLAAKKQKRRGKGKGKEIKASKPDITQSNKSINKESLPSLRPEISTKITKRPPPKLVKELKQPAVYVSTKTPFVSGLKRVSKHISDVQKLGTKDSIKKNELHVTVYGLGKAIDKALAIGLNFMNQYSRVEVLTGTVNVVDESNEDDENGIPKINKRKTSKVEIKIYVWSQHE